MTDHDASGQPDDAVPPTLETPDVAPEPISDPLTAPLEDLLAAQSALASGLPEDVAEEVVTAPVEEPSAPVGMDTELTAAPVEELAVEEPEPTDVEPADVVVTSVAEPAPEVVDEVPVVLPVPAPRPAAKPQHRSFLRELPVLVLIAFVLALLIKHFLVQAFYIPSGSMEQTLMVGDRVLVNKVPYLYRGPHRGEIVVFNGLDSFDDGVRFEQPTNPVAKVLRKVSSAVGLGTPNEKDYIKRVIGVPGDRVMCCDTKGAVVVMPKDGSPASLDEPYIYQNDATSNRYFCEAVTTGKPASKETCPPGSTGILVPPGRLWVMGDHRGNSSDSRFHVSDAHQGTVPEDKVVGRAFGVVYPFGRFGFLHVPGTFSHVGLPALPYVGGLLGALPIVGLRRRRLRAAR